MTSATRHPMWRPVLVSPCSRAKAILNYGPMDMLYKSFTASTCYLHCLHIQNISSDLLSRWNLFRLLAIPSLISLNIPYRNIIQIKSKCHTICSFHVHLFSLTLPNSIESCQQGPVIFIVYVIMWFMKNKIWSSNNIYECFLFFICVFAFFLLPFVFPPFFPRLRCVSSFRVTKDSEDTAFSAPRITVSSPLDKALSRDDTAAAGLKPPDKDRKRQGKKIQNRKQNKVNITKQ